jgi:hypothetical protein
MMMGVEENVAMAKSAIEVASYKLQCGVFETKITPTWWVKDRE